MLTVAEDSGTPSNTEAAWGNPWKWIECWSKRSGRMIIPTLVRDRKNSSPSVSAMVGAG